jgi:hypothetical protein
MNATNIRGRHTAVYAVQMLCGCLGLWEKIPGIRGSQNSVFKPTGVLNPETFRNRAGLTTWIYNNLCPTINDLRDLPPTEELYSAVASIVDSERDYQEKKRLVAQIVEAEKNQGQQTRAENAKHKREVMAFRRNARDPTNTRWASQNGMTGSDSQAWVMLRIGRSAVQSHKRTEPVNEESKVCRFGCPCRDDCGGGSGAERGGEVARGHSES